MKKIKLVEEFKAFISKGNVVDMAVGVVVGGAFGKFVVLGDRTGFDPAKYTTPALAAEAGYATLNYGNFIQTILDFLIIALAIFLVIKLMATAKSKLIHKKVEEPAPATTKVCPFCCTEIPIDAVKCPHCTSDLPEDKSAE